MAPSEESLSKKPQGKHSYINAYVPYKVVDFMLASGAVLFTYSL